MKESITSPSQTGRRKKIANVALAWALLFSTSWQAQEVKVQEKETDKKEIKVKSNEVQQQDSVIIWDEAVGWLEWGGDKIDNLVEHLMKLDNVRDSLKIYDESFVREILKKEIKQALKIIEEKYSEEFINKSIEEIVNNGDRIFDSKLNRLIKECVSDKNFQELVKNGEKDEIKKIIEEKYSYIYSVDKWNAAIVMVVFLVILFVLGNALGDRKEKKLKNN